MKKFNSNTFIRLVKYYFKINKWYMIGIFFFIILSSVGTVAAPVFIQKIIDDVINPGIKFGFDKVENTFIQLLITLAVIYSVAVFSNFLMNQLNAIATHRFLNVLRIDMFKKMEKLPISFFDQHQRGEIMSLYTNDADSIREFVSGTLPQIFNTIIIISSLAVMMMIYSLYLFIFVILTTVLILFATKKVGAKSAKFFIKQQKSIAEVEGFAEEMMNGLKVVKVFSHEKESRADFDKINDNLQRNSETANGNANMLGPIIHNIGNVNYVAIAIIGTFLVVFGVPNLSLTGIRPLEMGVVVSFLTMSRQFANNFNQISMQINTSIMAMAGATRCFELLDQNEEVDDGYVTLVNANIDETTHEITESSTRTGKWAWKHPHKEDGTVTYTELKGDILLDNVDFGYTSDKIVLHDVSVYAKPGQKIALVGSTGAGKTTITNLITRFYDLADGKVRYDGININKIKKRDLRESIGMVLQDTSLFTGTVKENIRYGKLDATDEEIIEASKIANAYDFITRLPQGFDTMLVADGANLSQGQRQLISIARAAIANAPVMILDEATSSIDTRTEKLVQKGMDAIMKGRTIFVIAHRLSTIQNSDAIMVLDHGRIIERGTHDELINKKGFYYQLYTGALELE